MAPSKRRTPPNLSPDRPAVLRAARPEAFAPRAFKDPQQLRELLSLADGLCDWTQQFDVGSPATVLAASMIGVHSVDACMQFIGDALLQIAPYAGAGEVWQQADMAAEKRNAAAELTEILNDFRFLQEYLAGNRRSQPEYPYICDYICDELPDDVTVCESWEPADEETEILVAARYRELGKDSADGTILARGRDLETVQRIHDRIGTLSLEVAENFIRTMADDDGIAGFPSVSRAINVLPAGHKHKTKATLALEEFQVLCRDLGGLLTSANVGPQGESRHPFGRPHEEFRVADVMEKIVAAGRKYSESCLPLLKPSGQSTEKWRRTLQKRRRAFLRRLAFVSQYAFLASGNGRYRWFAEILHALGLVALLVKRHTETLLAAVDSTQPAVLSSRQQLPRLLANRQPEKHRLVGDLNRLIIEPREKQRLEDALGSRAAQHGGIIAAIVAEDPLQDKPWIVSKKTGVVERAGLLVKNKKNKSESNKSESNERAGKDALASRLCEMQLVGLAVQVPWEFLLEPTGKLPRRKTAQGFGQGLSFAPDGLPWVVNPLGSVLAEVPPASAEKASQTARRQPSVGRKTTKQRPSPVKTQRLPKAAKRWPRGRVE